MSVDRGAAEVALPADPAATATDPVALWASARVTELGTAGMPDYGSPDWRRMRPDDPRRAAAVVVAAESWRRHQSRQAWLDDLIDTDPDQWFRIVTSEANGTARQLAYGLARQPTVQEMQRRRAPVRQPHELRATPGWPPIVVPGGRGRLLRVQGVAA